MRRLLKGANVIDGTARDPIRGASILIQDQRVAAIARATDRVDDWDVDEVLNLEGQFVIPGLFNLHEHIYRKSIRDIRPGWAYDEHSRAIERENDNYLVLCAARHALDALRSGITTMRTVGCRSNLIVSLKRAIDQGFITGPRLRVAVRPVVMTGGHGYYIGREADGPAEVRKAAREQLKEGADFIKIIATGGLLGMPKEDPGNPQFTVEEMRAAVEVAHSAGKLTTAHADATQGIQQAIEAGIDCIEHGAFLDDETIELMVKKDIPLVPTLSGLRGYAEYHRKSGKAAFADFVVQVAIEPHIASFRKAYAAGVRIGVGTDTPSLLIDELEDLNNAGMTPRECIIAATSVSAEIVGLGRDTGTIEVGKLADLVVLGSDPWQDIAAVRDVRMVMKAGSIILPDKPEL